MEVQQTAAKKTNAVYIYIFFQNFSYIYIYTCVCVCVCVFCCHPNRIKGVVTWLAEREDFRTKVNSLKHDLIVIPNMYLGTCNLPQQISSLHCLWCEYVGGIENQMFQYLRTSKQKIYWQYAWVFTQLDVWIRWKLNFSDMLQWIVISNLCVLQPKLENKEYTAMLF